jgi:peptide subunit release factor RF-3
MKSAKPMEIPTMGVRQAVDQQNREVVLFEAQWVLDYTLEKNPHIDFRQTM